MGYLMQNIRASRDTDPGRWYPPTISGTTAKFDDLPAVLRGNVDAADKPSTRREGDAPAWNDAEIDDVVAFLQTLTDRDAQPATASRSLIRS
jgi:cytochrome c peroxidase